MIELFHIALYHGYFADGVFGACTLVPDPASAHFLRRYRLTVRSQPGQIALYCDSATAALPMLGYLNDRLDGAPLQFLLMADEARFAQITDLPLDFVGQVMLSSSSTRVLSGSPERELIPQLGPRTLTQSGVIGAVSVHLADCLADGAPGIAYRANFQARVLHWLYYVVNRSQGKLHTPLIRNQQRIAFETPTAVTLPNGEAALSFSSGNLHFPLQQNANCAFDLIDDVQTSGQAGSNAVEHCLIRGLPTPDGRNLVVRQVDNNPAAFGEMVVYL